MKSSVCCFILLLSMLGGMDSSAGEIKILDWRRSTTALGMELVFRSEGSHYYEVWTTRDITGEWQCTAMLLGADGSLTWQDGLVRNSDARYYRLLGRSRSEPGDADNDGLDDVFELTQAGMDPLVRDPSLAVSVNVASGSIAAGALATEAHQTDVRLQVTPPRSYRLSVWIEGGDGYSGGGVSSEGPARLQGDAGVFVAGGVEASRRPIVVTTDTEGRAVLRLTSSNEVNEQCVVHARLGAHSTLTGSEARSAPVTFGLGTIEVSFPGYLARDAFAQAVVHRTFNGMPVSGHKTELFVRRIKVNSKDLTTELDQPHALASYAFIDPSQGRQLTDGTGQANASVFIRDVEGLGYVEVGAVDLQVFGE